MTLLWAALLVAADQASKAWAYATFAPADRLPLGAGIALTYVENTGAAFGLLRGLAVPLGPLTLDGTLLLGLLSLAVALYVAHLLWHRPLPAFPTRTALTLVLAGAVGNMIDRFRLGYVIDFVHVRWGALNVPVFNLADALVVVGATLLLLGSFEPRTERSNAAPPDAP